MTAPAWHAEPWSILRQRAERNALPHALLLAGPTGLGKREFLERFVRARLCQQPVDGEACGQCRACALLAAGSHPDRVAVTFAERADGKGLRSEIVVDQIRALGPRLAMASQFGGWQVASIDPADALNAAAANALLKTLEEPTPATLIVLVADAPWRLPATIRSRCQRVDFRLPSREEALAWLRAQGLADAAAALDAAGGNPGLALAFARDGALARRDEVARDLAALAQGRADAFALARSWADDAPVDRLWFAAALAADEARAQAQGARGPLGLAAADGDALGAWFAHANRTRELLRGPLRAELALLELLAAWR
ncbi:MAG: DNA polymerase III subunit delta' [Mizugakiibacter sp.]|uniref:DNA polymerase III subunit delta' n=1 Tax=Mizugakiibacter sp. TaxID=1972610 RepID=UPI0031BECF8E|nr:DNA polymerase III subunit delta' [Xanthomonadaceae bacterium]